ncbi:integral membrane protein-like protein [Massarina eburnea CBS 473.64]|uniref:Integral membrane protein-like protein n=1 Tax=Massarina eburnea CBS 473.64 TaxID=1395130 RepID=A0A6A6SE66_9PLEO|nr:integral membrane protein-like protein [Massarina eburnea CBS 473.64]
MSFLTQSGRHPLQRLNSPSKGISAAVHAIGLVSFSTSFKFLVDNPNAITISFGWHFQYLTILGISISTLCFTSGLIADITNSRTLFKVKNYLALVAAPIEVLICILYWGLRAIDDGLVIPPDVPMLALVDDVGFHLTPAVLLTVDTLFLSPPWPTHPLSPNASLITLLTSTTIAFLYWFWIELCYTRNGFYPYPIFTLLSTAQRVILFAGSGVAMWGIGAGLRQIYRSLNGAEGKEVGMRGKKMQ